MASEKAKALAAEQKAAAKAAKLAKKNSTNPSDWGWFRQIKETYRVTAESDPQLNMLMLAGLLGSTVVLTLLGIWLQPWWMWLILGIVTGVTVDLYLLIDRAKKATYKRYAGQPGSAEVALAMLDKKKWVYTPAITATRQLDVVHRAIGPGGIVLIGEGSTGRLKQLMAGEAKKHEQVAYGVKVTTVVMGTEEGQVPLEKLADHLKKMPKVLEPVQMTEIRQRLKALDAVRPKVPLPKGPMPSAKGVNRAMRGR